MDDWNQRLIQLDEVDSTNRFALDLVRSDRPSQGTIVCSKYQSEGRGQRGKGWQASAGENGLFSIIYYPNSDVAQQFEFNQRVSVGLWMALKKIISTDEVTIKWPNDIYVGRQKVAGILIQNVLSGKRIDHMIIGIGVNINQTVFPKELPNPTSLSILTGKNWDTLEVIKTVVESLDKTFWEMQASVIKAYYLQNLYLKSEKAYFLSNGQRFLGEIVGITKEGQLMVRGETGIISFSFGEIEYEQS